MNLSQNEQCPICGSNTNPLDVVDFNKFCDRNRDYLGDLSLLPIYFFYCENCNFCFSPEIYSWDISKIENFIYNDDYVKFDGEFLDIRPRHMKAFVQERFFTNKKIINHLDYGGGRGLMSRLLADDGWDSRSYDPYFGDKVLPQECFNLITCFEVFEHTIAPHEMMRHLDILSDSENGIILLTTLLSDKNIKRGERINWWYASPRNGHVSLFSIKSLLILSEQYKFTLISNGVDLHCFLRPNSMHFYRDNQFILNLSKIYDDIKNNF